jgi:hypothetical protein
MIEQLDHELEAAVESQRQKWLEKRLFAYCVFSMIGSAIFFAVEAGMRLWKSHFDLMSLLEWGGLHIYLLNFALYVSIFGLYRRKVVRQEDLVRLSFIVMTLSGFVLMFALPALLGGTVVPLIRFVDSYGESGTTFFGQILWLHGVAALFIPWTVREARKALWILCGIGIVSHSLFIDEGFGLRVLEWFLMYVAGWPGLLVCRLRYGRFHSRFAFSWLHDQYGQIRRELEQARAIHEMLFPRPQQQGPICFRYHYEPTQQIGGDYLYVHRETGADGKDRAMNLILIDVTGHGIGAALTVNRIHGELDQLYGERTLQPGEVIMALNHYFAVTLSRHGVYATALAVRIDSDNGRIEWANAGHPPAFITRRDGRTEMMNSNAVMLGVLDDAKFECSTCRADFSADDRLIAYTDGAIEASDPAENMLGIEGFQQMVQDRQRTGPGETLLDRIAENLQSYRQGPPKDDTLMVEAFLKTTA